MRIRKAAQSPKPEASSNGASHTLASLPAYVVSYAPPPAPLPKPPARAAPTVGAIAARAAKELEQREDDLSLLRALTKALAADAPPRGEDEEEEEDEEREDDPLSAFSDMLGKLEARAAHPSAAVQATALLSPKQREWALAVAERLELEWTPAAERKATTEKLRPGDLLVDSMPRPLLPPNRMPGRKLS